MLCILWKNVTPNNRHKKTQNTPGGAESNRYVTQASILTNRLSMTQLHVSVAEEKLSQIHI